MKLYRERPMNAKGKNANSATFCVTAWSWTIVNKNYVS